MIIILVLLVVLGYLLIEEVLSRSGSLTMNKKKEPSSDIISDLLQIVSSIGREGEMSDLLKVIMQKSREMTASDIAYLFFRDEINNSLYLKAFDARQDGLSVSLEHQGPALTQLMKTGSPLVVDKDHRACDTQVEALLKKLAISNTLAMPVYSQADPIGILGVGSSKESFLYQGPQIRLVELLSRQAGIALEHERLKSRLGQLEIKDILTGLYNKMYILNRLREEIRRAIVRQRPCSFVLLDVDDFQRFRTQFGLQDADDRLRQMASLIRNLASEIDPVAKFGDNGFAIVLPERNKRQAHEEADEIRKTIERTFSKEQDHKRRLTVSGGISENPLDGVTAEELVTNAQALLLLAKRGSKNTILV